eukprot:m.135753 g.135753  ORF g.135753 m.135753 type:complete len:186 (+) comp17565_c0_seq13:494-1051(+)
MYTSHHWHLDRWTYELQGGIITWQVCLYQKMDAESEANVNVRKVCLIRLKYCSHSASLADVFEASGQHATAHEFRCKVSDIWASILSTVLQNADAGKSTSLSLDVLETSDAQVHLTGLLSVYKNAEGAEHRALEGKLCSALATLYSTLNESALVKQYATLAVQLLQASNGQYLEDARLLLTRLEE